jgi:hypothetical protein
MSNKTNKRGRQSPNKQRRWDSKNKKMQLFNSRRSSAKNDQNQGSNETGPVSKGFIPMKNERNKRVSNKPCCTSEVEQHQVNLRLQNLLMNNPTWAVCPKSGVANIVVIPRWFSNRNRRHMKHFKAYLAEKGVRFTD